MTASDSRPYQHAYRRLLIDTQIADWDPALLARYDPASAVEAAGASGATALMVYAQSHTGLSHGVTRSGRVHRAFAHGDLLGETLHLAHARDLPVCGYYSVNFNNWAAENHPQWRLVPASQIIVGGGLLQAPRYGLCCPNHPGYRQFVRRQTEEILARYPFDAFFFDMMWWMSVCLCESCRTRYREECGAEIPTTIDWLDPHWCGFQRQRERWLTDLACELRALVRNTRPGIPVYHNFALGLTNWTRGVGFDSAAGHDFLGGDFYGDRAEQLVVSRLMLNLSATRPVEFMTTLTANLAEHERLKSVEQLELQSLAATMCGAAFLAIAAFDPDGRLNPAQTTLAAAAYRELARYETSLGGEPVEDIAVYFSSDSKMSFAENGRALASAGEVSPLHYPHLAAVRGACRALQERQRPFGVVTRRQLAVLDRHRVLVLPNVLRMDDAEVEAVRAWVHAGGRLYASRHTSLTHTQGARGGDFMLADVFGCHFGAFEPGAVIYLDPQDPRCAAAIAPQRMIAHWLDREEMTGAIRITASPGTRELMSLVLPYGHPSRGTASGHDWASIHSFPPWTPAAAAAIVEHEFGRGRVIFAAVDLEAGDSEAHVALFVHLMDRLLEAPPSFAAQAHPCVWMSAFDQPDRRRRIVSLLNYQRTLPVIPLEAVRVRVRPPAGQRATRLTLLPDDTPLMAIIDDEGGLDAVLPRLDRFAMLAVHHEPL